jgi:hypothetical protein
MRNDIHCCLSTATRLTQRLVGLFVVSALTFAAGWMVTIPAHADLSLTFSKIVDTTTPIPNPVSKCTDRVTSAISMNHSSTIRLGYGRGIPGSSAIS